MIHHNKDITIHVWNDEHLWLWKGRIETIEIEQRVECYEANLHATVARQTLQLIQ